MKLLRQFVRLAIACIAAFSSAQAASGQEEEQMRIEGEVKKPYVVRLETTQHKQYCQAKTSIEYVQNNTVASVSGKIENDDCPASSGEYTMNVRYRDSNGVVHDHDIEETWQRDDDQPIEFSKEYEIGKNVDLIRVRIRRMKCLCAEVQNADAVEIKEQKEE
jgi:hypothetical protein